MKKPTVELIPSRAAVCSDGPTELNVLIRIVPPEVETSVKRPRLNIGLVIDRSGSMSGPKIIAAKQAAAFAVQQLTATDRVSVTIFDDEVETIVSSTLAVEKASLLSAIERIRIGGTTALHAAWVEGGIQVSGHLASEQLNRVLLLTDGLADVGETNTDRICSDVNGLSRRGVSTTTMGVGRDYNEDLLEKMAKSGDGNYYFIEAESQLPEIFARELQGLMATVGHTVSLGIEPQGGVEVADVFNELERNSYGRLLLSNLIVGNPLQVVVRLSIPAQKAESDLCLVRLAWNDPKTGERQVMREALSLPVVSTREFENLQQNAQVAEQVGILELTRIRAQAIAEMERGDMLAARHHIQRGHGHVASLGHSPDVDAEDATLFDLEERLAEDDVAGATKAAKYQNYNRHHNR